MLGRDGELRRIRRLFRRERQHVARMHARVLAVRGRAVAAEVARVLHALPLRFRDAVALDEIRFGGELRLAVTQLYDNPGHS